MLSARGIYLKRRERLTPEGSSLEGLDVTIAPPPTSIATAGIIVIFVGGLRV